MISADNAKLRFAFVGGLTALRRLTAYAVGNASKACSLVGSSRYRALTAYAVDLCNLSVAFGGYTA